MQATNNYLDNQRLVGDAEADSLIETIFSKQQQTALYGLLQLEEKNISLQPASAIRDFMISRKEKPVWFNQKQLQNGQRLFKQYALEIMTLLGAMSLPYCYAASPGNKALYLSDKMRKAPGKRLMDTASFVTAVLSQGSLEAGGLGNVHINKVRLIHALSRYYLKKQPTWNMAWGLPINQEDMAGTNLAFSYVILLGMQQSGFVLSEKGKEDFLFVWRYIGYQLSIQEDLLPASFKEAGYLANMIKKRNFKKTEEGIQLTSELLSYYKLTVPFSQAALITSQVRMYLGDEVSGYIGIEADPIRDRLISALSTFKSLQNMFSIQDSSYQKMIFQQSALKKKLA